MKKRGTFSVLLTVAVAAAVLILRNTGATADDAAFDRDGKLVYTRHARCRMDCRHIDETEVKEILADGVINTRKSDPHHQPDPTWALEGTTHDGQHVRIVFAAEGNKAVVVTCIDLDKDWPCDCP